jgi:glycosyltransferase involved in cell wall biosynthesis
VESRIAIVLPNLRIGGAERIAITFAEELLAEGFAVDLVLVEATGDLLETVPKGAQVVDLHGRRLRSAVGPLVRYFRNCRPVAAYANIWPLTLATALAARLAQSGTRVVTMHQNSLGSQYVGRGRHSPTTMRAALRLELALATRVVGCSTGVIEDLALLAGRPTGRFTAVPNPVRIRTDVNPANLKKAEALWGVRPGKRVLAVGNLKAQKNFALLLEAYAAIAKDDHDRLILIGEGELRESLEAQARALGIARCVRMPGQSTILEAFYKTADLFVMCSNYEGLPTVLIEALGFGLPVVSTDCPSGPCEILDDGRFGTLVPMNDPAALAKAMEAALAGPVDKAALRSRAADFAPGAITGRLLGLLADPALARTKTD